jgi:hypothetical protein
LGRGRIGIQMMYLKSAFTNSKPIVKKMYLKSAFTNSKPIVKKIGKKEDLVSFLM